MSINSEKEIDYFLAIMSHDEQTLPIKTETDNQPTPPSETNLTPIPEEDDEEDGST